jgi:hypothetical protein
MTTFVTKTAKRAAKSPRSVRINVTHLTDEEMETLAHYLRKDPNIGEVLIAAMDTVAAPRPSRTVTSPSGKAVTYFLTIEASVQPIFLVVQFVHEHWELLKAANEALKTGTEAKGAFEAGNYIVKKIKAFIKNRKEKFEYAPIYGANGDIVLSVKKKKSKLS